MAMKGTQCCKQNVHRRVCNEKHPHKEIYEEVKYLYHSPCYSCPVKNLILKAAKYC
uniref:Folylpolyglutamate synthase-like isoform X2 n=1 Tax=Rhizophora mucronata TaxID=61149 RepID=A0A2P2M2L6_RHIMU